MSDPNNLVNVFAFMGFSGGVYNNEVFDSYNTGDCLTCKQSPVGLFYL